LSKAAAVFTNPKPVEGWVGQYDTPDRAVTFESDRHLHFLPLATSAREAIVGAMGPPRSQILTAIGDTVNTCARLESLTKDHDCAVIISRRAAEAADLDMSDRELHRAMVKGRAEPVQFYALKASADLPA
jgi:class 3 adenylate cyclase